MVIIHLNGQDQMAQRTMTTRLLEKNSSVTLKADMTHILNLKQTLKNEQQALTLISQGDLIIHATSLLTLEKHKHLLMQQLVYLFPESSILSYCIYGQHPCGQPHTSQKRHIFLVKKARQSRVEHNLLTESKLVGKDGTNNTSSRQSCWGRGR